MTILLTTHSIVLSTMCVHRIDTGRFLYRKAANVIGIVHGGFFKSSIVSIVGMARVAMSEFARTNNACTSTHTPSLPKLG